MSENEEIRIEARRRAARVAKTFGWVIGGEEYQSEFDDILDALMLEKVRRENEMRTRPRG